MLPEAPAATSTDAPIAKFYNVADATTTAPVAGGDQSNLERTIQVKYSVASTADAKTIEVTPVGGNTIIGVEIESVSGVPGTEPTRDTKAIVDVTLVKDSSDGTWTYTVSPKKNETMTYTVRVYYSNGTTTTSQEWILIQNAQETGFGELDTKYPANDTVNNPAGIQVVASDVANGTATVNVAKAAGTMLSTLEAMLKHTLAEEKVVLSVVDAGGTALSREWLENHTTVELVASCNGKLHKKSHAGPRWTGACKIA